MSLTLHMHPLSSFTHKVLFALYENETPFAARTVNLQEDSGRKDFYALWPVGKMPVLYDEAKKQILPESTIILEYLDQNYLGRLRLFPADPNLCREARLWDRIFDLYLHAPMQKIVGDRLRAETQRDPYGVSEAKALMHRTYDMLERRMENRKWSLGETLSVADCAAVPALFYGGLVAPFAATHPHVQAYFERLIARASVAKLLAGAKPYFKYFPYAAEMPARFLN